MGESKYLQNLDKLIEDLVSCTTEKFPSLKNNTKKCFDEISNYINNNKPENNLNINFISNYFITKLRLKYQFEIKNNILNENSVISKGKFICEFILWLINQTDIIQFQQIIKFLHDIIETVPLSGLEDVFDLISQILKKLEKSIILNAKLDTLFLQNLLLKRINNNTNDKLRGKILILFCDLFSIGEASGLNKWGNYSKNKINDELSNYSNDNSDTVINDEDTKMIIEDNNKKNISDDCKKGETLNLESNKNKMVVEEEKIRDKNDEKEKENKTEEKINNKEKDIIYINQKQNEKFTLYEQFWIIQKFLLNPFMVCNKFIIYIIIKYFTL